MSEAKIFLAGDTPGQWMTMVETPYDQEVVLQAALAEYPDLLPGDQIDPENPRQWILVRRELSVPAQEDGGSVGSLDHLYLDQDGIPTFVECKRAADTRSRREVVAQMLDYAANGTEYWPIWLKHKRYRIETVIGQLVERFQAKKVSARDAWHFWSRWFRRVLSHTFVVFLCQQYELPSLRFAKLVTD